MKDAPLLHAVEYAAYRVVRAPLVALPHAAARAVGRRLGDLGWWLDGRHRRVALGNLALALPEIPAAERRRLARACFRHFGSAVCESISASRFGLVELCRRLTLEGWDHFETARAAAGERGFFLLTAHFGLWEVAAHAMGAYAGPLSVVGRPLDNPRLDRELAALRGRFGNRLLPKSGAVRGMVRAIQRGELVGILIDQRVQRAQAIDVPFFGHPAWTTPVLARLSRRLAVPVVPVFGYPAPGGRYRVVIRPPVFPGDGAADEEAAVAALTRRYLAVMEDEIRGRPELWLWMHDRWRHS